LWIAAKIKSDISTKSITTSAAFQMPLAVMLLYFRRKAVHYYFILPLSTDLCETLKTAWLQVKVGFVPTRRGFAGRKAPCLCWNGSRRKRD